ncbi:hypothetical protein SYNTR_0619 [Candidatus Syntrophocurvum alkaliphilum]|uniref:Ribosomal protein eL8/eL30/eS12/Gadd45 domain-containing protein n=1 Tax=Candidatus Syntrophocurvum alkaliphilum TaxID=2293317 RepID=A0A6I6DEX3_9FIRM|nr:ribosomal L7Ae/L30e/S12e/Gadd45 family protein [Candidatus Syntrophocurvum alkaliphilum]QGT99212.1 hypothetical protein SYNTR_0619 [Candidatus Syntrophocurvum alkaliphilum]
MKKIYSLIGFATKAGKVSSGAMAAKTSLVRRKARLLIVTHDMSERARESLVVACSKNKVPWVIFGNKYELGTSVGKAYRVAITINDKKIADAILDALKTLGEEVNIMGVVEWPK